MNCWGIGTLVAFAVMSMAAGLAAEEPALPAGAVARLGDTRYLHAGGEAAGLSPDGRKLAIVTAASVVVWDLDTGRPLYRLGEPDQVKGKGAERAVRTALFTPDGKHLLTLDDSGLRVWDAATGKPVRNVAPPDKKSIPGLARESSYRRKVTKLLGCPGGSHFLIWSDSSFVFLLDPFDWSMSYQREMPCFAIATCGNGRLVVEHMDSDAVLNCFWVRDITTGKVVFDGEIDGDVLHAALSVDGQFVAVNGSLWNLRTKAEVKLERPDFCRSTFAPDGKTLFGAGSNAVHCWDVASGRRLLSLKANGGLMSTPVVSADGKTLATTGSDRVIRRFDLTAGREVPNRDGFTGWVASALSADGKGAAAGDRVGLLQVWVAPFTGVPQTLRKTGLAVDQVAFSPDNQKLFAAYADRSVGVWDVGAGKEMITLQPPAGFKNAEYDTLRMSVSPDGQRIACYVRDRAWVVEISSGRILWKSQSGTNILPAFSSVAGELYIGFPGKEIAQLDPATRPKRREAEIAQIDLATGREMRRLVVPGTKGRTDGEWEVGGLAISPNGRQLAIMACRYPGLLSLMDTDTGQGLWQKRFGFGEAVLGMAFAPSGNWLLTVHEHGRICIWETSTGNRVLERTGPVGHVGGLQVSADGRMAIADTAGACALVWSLMPTPTDGPAPGERELWEWLAGNDAGKAYRACWALADRIDALADAIRKRLPVEKGADPADSLSQWLANLDHRSFQVREKASQEIASLLSRFPSLRSCLRATEEKTESAEVRKRLNQIIRDATPLKPTTADLQRARVLAAVELSGSAEARRLLNEWAAGTPAYPLTVEAKEASNRLSKR